MPLELDHDTLRLQGKCRLEEAEALREALNQAPNLALDLSACTEMHTGILQLLLASNITPSAWPDDHFYKNWLAQYFNAR